jgi:hypothetical protein
MSIINPHTDDNLRAESFAAYDGDEQVLNVDKVQVTFTVQQWEYLVGVYAKNRDKGQPTVAVEICAGNRKPPTVDPRPGASIKLYFGDGDKFGPIVLPEEHSPPSPEDEE